MSDASTPPNWYPDPTGRHQFRYWDGTDWTDQVADHGSVGVDPLRPDLADSIDHGLTVGGDPTQEQVSEMVRGGGIRGAGIAGEIPQGDGSLWGEPVLVVSQKAKLIEVTNQYSVFDQHGQQLAFVNEVGQSAVKKALRVLTSFDQFMSHRLEITDRTGAVQLRLTRPAKVFKSTIVVEHPQGGEIGRIVQENVFGKIRFSLESDGRRLGSINAENWRAWNFSIRDAADAEIARITKTWEGLAKTLFTTADNYVVQLHTRIEQPLLSLVVASALTVDTALKQDSRGLG
jgi:uncharacterized protein YxjI